MKTEDTIEKIRQDFFTKAALAASLIRMNFLNVAELDDTIKAASGRCNELAQAYWNDISRMYDILEQLGNGEVPEEL